MRRAAEKSIKIKGDGKERKIVPWWNQACNEAVRARNRAYRQLRGSPVESHVIEYKRLRAEAKKVIKWAMKESWCMFGGTLGIETTVKQVWSMIYRIAGISRGLSIHVLV